jgi:hypothetical protein
MNSRVAKDIGLIAAIGIAYYFLYTNVVGIAAAIAFPEWYVPFAQENKALALVLFSMVTTVPAAAMAAVLAGYSIAKLVSDHRVWWGVVIVVGITLYSVLTLKLNGGFLTSLTSFVVPSSVIDVPMLIAWWTFLPLSIALFVWRSKARSE